MFRDDNVAPLKIDQVNYTYCKTCNVFLSSVRESVRFRICLTFIYLFIRLTLVSDATPFWKRSRKARQGLVSEKLRAFLETNGLLAGERRTRPGLCSSVERCLWPRGIVVNSSTDKFQDDVEGVCGEGPAGRFIRNLPSICARSKKDYDVSK